MLTTRLEHNTLKVRDLINNYHHGKIVVPEFQREYVWKPQQAPKLLDSLFHRYPVSSLLLWESNEDIEVRRRDPRPTRGDGLSWLIDGQQRLITLSRIYNGDEGIDVVFHPETDGFMRANAATRKDPSWYRVTELWNDESFRRIRRNLSGDSRSDCIERKLELVRSILDYEIPYVKMVGHAFDDAVHAFERINTLGVKLKKEDIQSAHVARKHSGFIREDVVPFLSRLHEQGFTRLSVTHLFHACSFVARPDGRRRVHLHELETNEVRKAWATTKAAIEDTINLIHGELGLINMKILWSGALLVPPFVMCALLKNRERDSSEIAGWMALASLCHRYSGASQTALEQDLRACSTNDPIGGLLSNLRQERGSLYATERDFSGSLADRSALFAAYIACKSQGAVDLITGAKLLLHAQIERHHILPRALFSPENRSSADALANIAFIIDDSNKQISDTRPESYLSKIPSKVLSGQCIPTDRMIWSIGESAKFWEQRRELLADAFNKYLKSVFPRRRLG